MVFDILVAIVAFSGIVVGFLLSKCCAGEIEPGKKYFKPLKMAILLIIGLALFANTFEHYTFFVIGCLAGYVFKKSYFYLGVAMVATLGLSLKMATLVGSLIFIFGLPEGSLLQSWKRELLLNAVLFALPFAFLLADLNMQQFLSFAAGGVLISPFAEMIENFINAATIYKRNK